jgi:glyoxylase-like metal-dependent hydrolase (beta-lactamase superfamily II)
MINSSSRRNMIPLFRGKGMEFRKITVGKTNCYLLTDGRKGWLVDTGVKEDPDPIFRAMDGLGLAPADLDAVIITHTHNDHVKGLSHIKKYTGAAVIVHQEEAQYLRDGNTPLPAGTGFFSRMIRRMAANAGDASFTAYKSVIPDITVDGKTELTERGLPGYLLPTPGHTAGSLSLILENTHAFVGDALFHLLPWKIYPPFANDPAKVTASWKVLLDTGCEFFYPAHGGKISRNMLENRYGRVIRKG